jgi:ribosomal protein L12E/L44/L45/RPP1/RPP2
MAFARDIMRAERRRTLAIRKAQAARNAEAEAEEKERQDQLPGSGHFRPKARKMHVGSPEDKMLREPLEDKAFEDVVETFGDPLEGVPWASPQAYAKAKARNLTADDFAGRDYTGRSGFTAGDVAKIAAEVFGP